MSARRGSAERQEAIERLRGWLKPDDTVHTILRHVSRSGMQRVVGVKLIHGGGRDCGSDGIAELSYNVALALGMSFDDRREGVKIDGIGTDVGFEIVYTLGRTLWPDGFGQPCISDGCEYRPASKVEAATCNAGLREGVTPHHFRGRNGDTSGWDNDGGYALEQRWL